MIFINFIFGDFINSQTIVKDIPYISSNETDVYRKERCKLDIAYYDNLKNRPVVIFFHGGGLTTDVKSFPGYYRRLQ